MATPGRILPPRAAKSAARGVILSTVLQDHPRAFSQNRDGSDARPQAQAAQPAQTHAVETAEAQAHHETPRSRRGRPKKARNRTGFVGNFPGPVSDSEFENSGISNSARSPRADQDDQRESQVTAQSLDNTLLGSPSGGLALGATHGTQAVVQTIPNIVENFAKNLISAINSQLVADPAHQRAFVETQAQAPQSDSEEAQATIPFSRQAGTAVNPSGPNSNVVRNLAKNLGNLNSQSVTSCAQDYSPRLQRSGPRLPESRVSAHPEAQVQRRTSLPSPMPVLISKKVLARWSF